VRNEPVRNEPVRIEQVRKRGLPPPLLGLDERGQAPLPDLFISYLFYSDWLYSDLFYSDWFYSDLFYSDWFFVLLPNSH